MTVDCIMTNPTLIIYGKQPTSGVVPNFGQYPCADGTADHILTTGPITRYAQDLWPMLMAMKGVCVCVCDVSFSFIEVVCSLQFKSAISLSIYYLMC